MSDSEPNEIVAAAKHAKAQKVTSKPTDRSQWPLKAIGLGVGIGSAAVAAAMLYANRDKAEDD